MYTANYDQIREPGLFCEFQTDITPPESVYQAYRWIARPMCTEMYSQQDKETKSLYIRNVYFSDGFNETWTVEYQERFSVTLSDAEIMVKTLKKIERNLYKSAQLNGSVKSYGQYLVVIAKSVKLTKIILPNSVREAGVYLVYQLGEGADCIDRRIAEHKAQVTETR